MREILNRTVKAIAALPSEQNDVIGANGLGVKELLDNHIGHAIVYILGTPNGGGHSIDDIMEEARKTAPLTKFGPADVRTYLNTIVRAIGPDTPTYNMSTTPPINAPCIAFGEIGVDKIIPKVWEEVYEDGSVLTTKIGIETKGDRYTLIGVYDPQTEFTWFDSFISTSTKDALDRVFYISNTEG